MPCNSTAPSTEPASPLHAPMVSRSTSGLEAPAGQHQSTNPTAPISSAKQQKATNRTTPNAVPISGLPPWLRVAGLTVVLLGAPIENVNAPCTGCDSAEITCQPTVYVPLPSPDFSGTAIWSGVLPCVVPPVSTRAPVGEKTSRLVRLTPTGSSNVAVTWVGACGTIEPSAGLVASRVACAQAAGGPASRPNPARNSVATR